MTRVRRDSLVRLMAIIPNLDALIRREDFDIDTSSAAKGDKRDVIDITALSETHFTYRALRKPDFQRETAHWSSEKIKELIRSYLDGDLIPALILWSAGDNTFVIDGAHRLSALISWVNNDYGDGRISRLFFGSRIAEDQLKAAEKTRREIHAEIGAYAEYQALAVHPDPSKPDKTARAARLGQIGIKVQWVEGDSKKAEESFYRINLSATPIDDTELSLIRARRKPNALATRAIIRAGSGHKYWMGFEDSIRDEIENKASALFDLLCNPPLIAPIKTLDLPAAGSGYSSETVRLIYDFVNYVHSLRADMWLDKSKRVRGIPRIQNQTLQDDTDGTATLEYLKRIRKIADRITGKHPGSLGLHPAVYFYGATGLIQSTAFLAIVALIQEMELNNGFEEFTLARSRFEEFLITYRHFINQISGIYGSGMKGLDPLIQMYKIILSGIKANLDDKQIIRSIQSDKKLEFIREITDDDRQHGRNFSKETKNAAFMKKALAHTMCCAICGARLHTRSISDDHIQRKEDLGIGTQDNLQHTHFYCNTTFKELEVRRQRRAAHT